MGAGGRYQRSKGRLFPLIGADPRRFWTFTTGWLAAVSASYSSKHTLYSNHNSAYKSNGYTNAILAGTTLMFWHPIYQCDLRIELPQRDRLDSLCTLTGSSTSAASIRTGGTCPRKVVFDAPKSDMHRLMSRSLPKSISLLCLQRGTVH
jgi:hypothetical protein